MEDPGTEGTVKPVTKQRKPRKKPCPIDRQIQKTYSLLRLTAAAIALVFPFLLWIGGGHYGIPLRSSMSDYYWAVAPNQLCPCELVDGKAEPCMEPGTAICIKENAKLLDPHKNRLNEIDLHPGTFRNWFVGLLFATGAVLFVNRGYTLAEDIALSIAGVFAWGIAMFPEHWTRYKDGLSMHGVCAMTFFAAIAFVAIWCSRNTLYLLSTDEEDPKPQKTEKEREYSKQKKAIDRAYKLISAAMIVSPLAAYIVNLIGDQHSLIYWLEVLGIYAFAAYWLVKSYEIKCIQKKYGELGIKHPLSEPFAAPFIY